MSSDCGILSGMETHKATIRIDPELWSKVHAAARAWAIRESLPPEGKTTAWIARVLSRAVDAEMLREESA